MCPLLPSGPDLAAAGLPVLALQHHVFSAAFTHDRGAPRMFDSAFMARVGRGILLATCLDHTEDPGRYLLQRLMEWLTTDEATCRTALDPVRLRGWTIESAAR